MPEKRLRDGDDPQPPPLKKKQSGVKKTTEQFVKDGQANHKNEDRSPKYDYSKVVYVNSITLVLILCPIHGEFRILPNTHLRRVGNVTKGGCQKCGFITGGNKNRTSVSDFVMHAQKIHPEKYRYDKVVYIASDEKVTIYCLKHQTYFEQTPSRHLRGSGCPRCGIESVANSLTKSQELYIRQASAVHNGKYRYDKTVYVRKDRKIIIHCPVHQKDFEQEAGEHLRGSGCPLCGQESRTNKCRKSVEDFVESARKIHHDKYDYSGVQYTTNMTKVSIICPRHGEFKQTPNGHLRGSGCPACNQSHMEREMMALLQDIRDKQRCSPNAEWQIESIVCNQCIFPGSRLKTDFFVCLVDSLQQRYHIVIEMHGDQHFEFVRHFHKTEERFRGNQGRDRRKIELCKENGYPMLFFDNTVPKEHYDCIVRTFFDVTMCGSVENACFGNWFRPGSFPL